MTRGDLILFVYAVCLGLPLSMLAWNFQRMQRKTQNIVLVAEDLVGLLEDGDFVRATSRLDEIGGSLGRDVQELLRLLLRNPWVGAGNAVRIAEENVAPLGGRPFGVIGCIAVPIGILISFSSRVRIVEQSGTAVALFGLVSFGVMLALPLFAHHFKLRIIRTLHDVQHAAERWLKAHREPGPSL